MKPSAQDKSSLAAPLPPIPHWQIVASVLILLHLTAVWVGPFSVPPSSPLAQTVANWFRPYLQATFLNHGYKFFAPDPGPTHLVRYELELADGTARSGVFPNLQEQQPRLLYHRHMMLSERLDGPPQAEWIAAFTKSYAQHLLHEHQARRVKLYLVTHALPSPQQVQAGMKLTDPALYRERELIALTRDNS